ncbi:thiol reductant ABC exporter subunit CydC [Amycolatopsis sp. NPDC003676]
MSTLLRTVLRWAGGRALRGLALAAAAGAASELASVGLMATATWLIVRAAQQPPVAALGLAIVGVRAFALSRGAFRYVERLSGHHAALSVLVRLRRKVFEALERGAPNRLRSGDSLSRMVSDVDAIQDLLLRSLAPFAVAVVVGTGVVIAGLVLHPVAGAVLAGGLAAAVMVVPALACLRLRQLLPRVARAQADLGDCYLDLAEGAAELAVYGARGRAEQAARATARNLAELTKKGARVVQTATAAVALVQAVTTLVVLLVSGSAVLTLTALTVFAIAAPLPSGARHLAGAAAPVHRIEELLAARAAFSEPEHPRAVPEAVAVELTGIRVRYDEDRAPALDGFDLRVEPGKRVALVGASGSGKSTVLAVLSRLAEPDAGRYFLNDHDVREYTTVDVRARITGAAQDAYVFHASLRDNLALARPAATDSELEAAARRARLELPGGLDTVAGHDGSLLSGGQRQRLVLARALLADPAVLLLDEPVEGVDPPTAAQLLAEALDATRGHAVVLVTHTLAGLDAVDEIVVLDQGRAVQRGAHAELVAEPGPYRRLWEAENFAAGPSRAPRRL